MRSELHMALAGAFVLVVALRTTLGLKRKRAWSKGTELVAKKDGLKYHAVGGFLTSTISVDGDKAGLSFSLQVETEVGHGNNQDRHYSTVEVKDWSAAGRRRIWSRLSCTRSEHS
jgi:hypothetical protein